MSPLARVLLLALLAVVAATALTACDDEDGGGVADGAGAEVGADVGEVESRPISLLGHTVTLTADVEEVIGARAVALETPGDDRATSPGLLVVAGPGIDALSLDEGQAVRVTGEVQYSFDIAAAERELGVDLGVEGADLAFYRTQEYVVATSVLLLDEAP